MTGEIVPRPADAIVPAEDAGALEPLDLRPIIPGRLWFNPNSGTLVARGFTVTPERAGIDVPRGEQLVELAADVFHQVSKAAEAQLAVGGIAQQAALPASLASTQHALPPGEQGAPQQ